MTTLQWDKQSSYRPHDNTDDAHNDLVEFGEELAHDSRAFSHHSDDDAERDAEDQHTCTIQTDSLMHTCMTPTVFKSCLILTSS